MAVAFDTANSLNGTGTSITVSLTLGAGANFLLVFVGIDSASNFNPTGTWNGVSIGAVVEEVFVGRYAARFEMVNPDTGTHDLVISGLPSGGQEHVIALAFSGVDTTDPTDPAQSHSSAAGGGTQSLSNSSDVGDMVASFMAHDGSALPTVDSATDDPAMTVPTNGSITDANMCSIVSYQDGQATVVSAWADLNQNRSMFAVNINAAAGGGPPVTDGPKLHLVRGNLRLN